MTESIDYYPILMDLRGRNCLVVGGGHVASRKVQGLLQCGARVTVVAPRLAPELAAMAESGAVLLQARDYEPSDMEGQCLVIAATDDAAVNEEVSREAQARAIPVNVVDRPAFCSFIVPAIHRDGDLCVAVSTGGRSPGAASQIRDEIARSLGPGYRDYLVLIGEARNKLKESCTDPARRRAALAKLTDGRLLDLIRRGDAHGAKELIQTWLSSESD